MPIAEVANGRPRRQPIDGAITFADFTLSDAHRDHGLISSKLDAQLKGMSHGLSHHRPAVAIGQKQAGVLEVATVVEPKGQLTPQGARCLIGARALPHRRREIEHTGELLRVRLLLLLLLFLLSDGQRPLETESGE
jgi:hypothetical protein